MKKSTKKALNFLAITTAIISITSFTQAAPKSSVKPLAIGKKAPSFNLKGTDGKTYQLSDYADKEVMVVVFGCNHCPFMIPAWTRLNSFAKDYAGKSVGFVVINSNDPEYGGGSDNFEAMVKEHTKQSMQFPYIYDGENQDIARAYGALATPHAYIFNKERKLVYQGRFDGAKRSPGPTTDNTVRDNVDTLLAGKDIKQSTTKAVGCGIKWKK